jgi:hypothetical protein
MKVPYNLAATPTPCCPDMGTYWGTYFRLAHWGTTLKVAIVAGDNDICPAPVEFCPFCGERVEIEQERSE